MNGMIVNGMSRPMVTLTDVKARDNVEDMNTNYDKI